MIDLETLSVQTTGVILSIGAVAFDIDTGKTFEQFEIFPEVDSQLENRTVAWSTIKWWFTQEHEARQSQVNVDRIKLDESLKQLINFISLNCESGFKVWANGFDINLLDHAYNQIGIKSPWSYKNVLDLRSMVWLSKISTNQYGSVGTKHTALADCLWQIAILADAYKIIKEY